MDWIDRTVEQRTNVKAVGPKQPPLRSTKRPRWCSCGCGNDGVSRTSATPPVGGTYGGRLVGPAWADLYAGG